MILGTYSVVKPAQYVRILRVCRVEYLRWVIDGLPIAVVNYQRSDRRSDRRGNDVPGM